MADDCLVASLDDADSVFAGSPGCPLEWALPGLDSDEGAELLAGLEDEAALGAAFHEQAPDVPPSADARDSAVLGGTKCLLMECGAWLPKLEGMRTHWNV